MIGQLVAELQALVPGLPVLLGAEALAEHASPPRIVCVPTSATYAAPEAGGGVGPRGALVPRALWERTEHVDWYVWADDYEQAEQASDELAAALRAVAGSSVDLVDGQWLHATDAQWLHRGRVYVLRSRIRRPVPRVEQWGVLERWAKECVLEVTV